MGVLQMSWQSSLLKLSKRKHGAPPLGLKNLGNTCYLNSVLQCLTYTPPLANLCLQCFHSSVCDYGAGRDKRRDCPLCILEKRITRSLSIEAVIDAPAKINSCLRIYAEHFRGGRQEDAHEFLRYVIDACHNTCLRLKKFQLQQRGRDLGGTGETIVKEIFGGELQSQVKCLSCGAESNKDDEIMDISLDIFHSSSLRESLQKFFQPEILEGNNKYKCENCKELVAAKKQMSLLQAPNVLVIQLKRFEGIYGSKIDKPITFDDYLLLSSYMSKGTQDHHPEYTLCGTIVHSGVSPDSGHYYAYIKDTVGHWYCCDDSSVTLSSLQEVLSERVYILFFSRTKQRPQSRSEVVVNGIRSHESKDPRIPIKRSASFAKPSSSSSRQDAACERDTQADLKASVKHSDSNGLTSHPTSNGTHRPGLYTQNGMKFEEHSEASHEKIADSKESFNNRIPETSHASSNHQQVSPADDDLKSKCNLENGFISPVYSMKGKKGEPMLKEDNCVRVSSGDAEHMKATPFSGISNGENGSTVSKARRRLLAEFNGTRNMSASENGFKPIGVQNRDVLDSSSKRKTIEYSSCVLLSSDDKSCAKLEAYKELMKQDASKVLRTCGWYEEVYSFMHSRKKACQESGVPLKTASEIKSSLIADAKKLFNCKVPNSLKASLFEGLESFGLGRDPPQT